MNECQAQCATRSAATRSVAQRAHATHARRTSTTPQCATPQCANYTMWARCSLHCVLCTVVPSLSRGTPARPVLRPHVVASLCGAAVPAASSGACPVWGLLVGALGSAVLPQPFGCLAAVVAALAALDVRGFLDGRRPRDGARVVAGHSPLTARRSSSPTVLLVGRRHGCF